MTVLTLKRPVIAGLIIFFISLSIAGCRKFPVLMTPSPIKVTSTDEAAIAKGIKIGLLKRNWSVIEEKPGLIVASQSSRGAMAEITITYNTKMVQIKYKDSHKLRYEQNEEDGKEHIHPTYNTWVRNLNNDIRGALLALD